jgi:osmotically-inducible protein OsmY
MKTDSQLKQDVTNELNWEPSVTETHIGVSVNNGIVTLSGHVSTFGEKYGAERAAKRVHGVKAVADELDVRLAHHGKRSDEDIAAACLAALKAHISVPDEKLRLVVNAGWVTIEGTADWQYQREAAESAIRYLHGVLGITNSTILAPRAIIADVKDKIEAAFKRSAGIDASQITVEAFDGKVVLRGQVHSWTEKNAAQYAAWAAPGVFAVENDLVVTA